MRRTRSRAGSSAMLFALTLLLLLSCETNPSGPLGLGVEIRLSADRLVIDDGGSARLEAVVTGPSGNALGSGAVSWSSSAPAVASVDETGEIRGLHPGTAKITATSGSLSASAQVEVRQVATALEPVGGSPEMASGAPQASVEVRVLDRHGAPVPAVPVEFLVRSGGGSVSPTEAISSESGVVSTMWTAGEGDVQVLEASADGLDPVSFKVKGKGKPGTPVELRRVSGDAQVGEPGSVLPLPLVVKVSDHHGSAVAGVEVRWRVVAGGGRLTAGSVRTNSLGLAQVDWVLGPQPGSNSANASVDGLGSVSFTATATSNPIAAIAVEPETAVLDGVADTLRFSATALDSDGVPAAGLSFVWSSSDPAVATVDASGLATATGHGSTTITATAEGVTGSAGLGVGAPAADIRIAPAVDTLNAIGDTLILTITATDEAGQEVATPGVSWHSLDPAIATVDAHGRVAAVAPGKARVVASTSSAADSADIQVRQVVAGVAVDPGSASLAPGETRALTAAASDSNGVTIAGITFAWTSADEAVATVGPQGLVTAVQAGTTTVSAIAGAVSGGAAITVTASDGEPAEEDPAAEDPATPASVHVAPAADTLNAIGHIVRLSATVRDESGAEMTGTAVSWSSLDGGVATVDSEGLVTARAVGTAGIVGTAGGVADTASIVVRQVVATVAVDPASASVEVGATVALSAVVSDSNGVAVAGASVAWTSADAGVATVDGHGVVTGVAAGEAAVRATSGGKSDASAVTVTAPVSAGAGECDSPGAGWIWCDDFEEDRLAGYFEYNDAAGDFGRVAGVGVDGSTGMRARWSAGEASAGNLHLAFGRTPQSYMRPVDAGTAEYREIYWRVYLKNEAGWTGGGGDKLARATIFASTTTWAQAMIAHVWSGSSDSSDDYLVLDPASGTDEAGTLKTTKYNDFANLRWLGLDRGDTPLFADGQVGQWRCIETRVRLNDAGQANGVFELWIDGELDAQRTGLNWVGAYDDYGINAVFIENHWNDGAPRAQERYIDNIVVSTQRIGCDGSPPPPSPTSDPEVQRVVVSPAQDTLDAIGDAVQLSATALDGSGDAVAGAAIAWSTLNAGVATVDDVGRVIARATGTAAIVATATCCNRADTASVLVRQVVSAVSVTPAENALAVGETADLTAVAEDANGVAVPDAGFTWRSSNTAVATVADDGRVTGIAAGGATITATSAGVSGTAQVTVTSGSSPGVASVEVTPASVTLDAIDAGTTLSATARDGAGNVLTGVNFAWSTLDPGIASVTADGAVTAEAGGTARIVASASGAADTAVVTVDQVPTRVAVAPASDTLDALGATLQLNATAYDRNGHEVPDAAITWTSLNATIASVSSAGRVTAKAVGLALITASAPGCEPDTSEVLVRQVVASVEVSPASASVDAGATIQLSATARDSGGTTIPDMGFDWSSSDASVATVGGSGAVTGVAAGSATIQARAAGESGSAAITVSAAGDASCPVPDIASHGFDDKGFGPFDDQFSSGFSFDGGTTASGAYSLRRAWSTASGDTRSWATKTFDSETAVRVRFDMRLDPSFDWTSGAPIMKLVRFRETGWNTLLGTLYINGNDILWFYDGLDASRNWPQNVGPAIRANSIRGEWHSFEVLNDITSSGALKVKLWIDGELKMDHTIPHSSQGKRIGIVMMGGFFNAPGGNMSTWHDEFAVSTRCIGVP